MNNLAEIMKRKKITAVELSRKTGLQPETIRRLIRNSNATPNNHTACELSKALGYTVAQIRGEKEI